MPAIAKLQLPAALIRCIMLLMIPAFLLLISPSNVLATASPSVKLTAEEQKWLDEHPEIKIGIRETPPLIMIGEKGEGYQGLSIDYIDKMEKLLGIRFNLVYYPSWKELIDETKARKVDIIVTGTITLDRSSFLDFTPSYIQLHNKIIVRKDLDNAPQKLADLSGLKVAAVEGTAVYKFIAQKYPDIKLVATRDEVAALEAVSFGETYAAVMEMARATHYIEQEKITNLSVSGDAEYLYNFCFSSRNDWPQLGSILTKTLSTIPKKERKTITDKWLHGYKINIFQSRGFWVATGIALGVTAVLLIILWNIALRRKVAKSTALIMREIEQLGQAEDELRRLNRTLMVLGKSHEILMQFTEEITLYGAICKHLVEVGGYREACTVLKDDDNLRTVAGYSSNCLESDNHQHSAHDTAVSSIARRAIISEAVAVDRSVKGIGDDAEEEGVSIVAIPLWGEGTIIGALEIISASRDAFDSEEVSLLTELTENLAYTVVAIRLKEEHKASEELVRKLSQAVEQSPVTIIITDSKGTIEYVNPCFTRITGYTFDEAVGQNPRVLKSGVHTPEFYKTLWDLINSGFEWHGEICNKRKNGQLYWESASISPVRNADGEITHFIAVKEDITDQKKAYEELQRAKAQAEAATNAKSSFLANMSHEIRTPMNAVIGMLYLVQQSELTDNQKNYIVKAEGAAKSLLKIINDILDFSKIEAGRLQMESIPFLLSEVLTKVADIAPVNIGGKKVDLVISVSADTPDFLNGDPLRLGQILLNLVSNAIKFTEKGDVLVSISLVSISPDKACIRFSVEDSGIGMTHEQKERLFAAFNQADSSTTRRFGGTGLGLTISKQLIELMGGEIHVESALGEGSVFSFTANFSLEDGHNAPLSDDFKAINGLRILHLSCMSKGAMATARMLASFGCKITSITPAEAISLDQSGFDLLLYDIAIADEADIGGFSRVSCMKSLVTIPSLLFTNDRKLGGIDRFCSQLSAIVVKPTVPTNLLHSVMVAVGITEKREKQRDSSIAVEGYFKGRHILLAEDNLINQEVAKGILERWGIELDIAGDGAAALQMATSGETHYDAILMDLQMPVMDGFEATRLIRAALKDDKLPIIAMTASAMTADRDLCIAAGMNDHVAKPIDVAELFSTLHRWFKPESDASKAVLAEPPLEEVKGGLFPDDTPGIDLEKAMKRLGSQQILLTVLKEFRRLHAEDDIIIRGAVETGSNIIAKRAAHTLKGLARTVGAEETGKAAADIEDAVEKCSHEELLSLMDTLSEKMKILNRSLMFLDDMATGEATPQSEDHKAEGGDPAVIAEQLKELAQQLDNNNLEACATFNRLKHLIAADALKTSVAKMEASVESLNFSEAKIVLQNIADTLNIKI